jgi:chorismate--pyruvate lyase
MWGFCHNLTFVTAYFTVMISNSLVGDKFMIDGDSNWLKFDLVKELEPLQKKWLCDKGSLTQRLRSLTNGAIKHHLFLSGWGYPTDEESKLLGCHEGDKVWVRHMQWRHENECWVVARAVIPESLCDVNSNELLLLGERSLGEVLFKEGAGIRRSDIEVCSLKYNHPYTAKLGLAGISEVLTRRSLFHLGQTPLLVVESFLPSLFSWVKYDRSIAG